MKIFSFYEMFLSESRILSKAPRKKLHPTAREGFNYTLRTHFLHFVLRELTRKNFCFRYIAIEKTGKRDLLSQVSRIVVVRDGLSGQTSRDKERTVACMSHRVDGIASHPIFIPLRQRKVKK